MNDKKKKIVMIVGAIAVMIAMYFIYEHLTYVSTDNAQIEGHTVMLAAKVGGYIKTVNAVDGQKVKKGDILVEIDDRDQANAVKQLQAQLEAKQARRRESERTFQRTNELYKTGAVSQAQYDQAIAAYNDVKGQYDANDAQLAQAQLNLEYTKIVAPSDGFIARTSAEIGQLVAPGVPLMGFVSAEERWVTANFKETELASIRPGAEVDVDVDALPSSHFKGKVATLDPATGATFALLPPDNATGNFTKVVQRVPVRIVLQNLSASDIEALRAGFSAVVKVHK